MNKVGKCYWHKWNVYKSERYGAGVNRIVTTTKECRKCGEVKVKERIW